MEALFFLSSGWLVQFEDKKNKVSIPYRLFRQAVKIRYHFTLPLIKGTKLYPLYFPYQ